MWKHLNDTHDSPTGLYFCPLKTEKASEHYAKELDAHRTTVVKPGADRERSSVLAVFRKVRVSKCQSDQEIRLFQDVK